MGTELASGDFIQYLDADDRLRPRALERRITALEEAPADVAYSAYQCLVESGSGFSLGDTVEETLEEVHPDPEIATVSAFWVPPAALTYRREVVEAIGEWNESLPVIQDARFLQDAAFHGARFVKVSEVLAEYRDHENGSLSTQDQHAFNRDIWVNARQIEERWREQQEELTDAQKKALAKAYNHCALSFFGVDQGLYTRAVSRLRRLAPTEASDRLEKYVHAEQWLGYRFASVVENSREAAIRGMKRVLRPLRASLQDPIV
jgi:glycosyltransferase involved in cell wall biosynthesis